MEAAAPVGADGGASGTERAGAARYQFFLEGELPAAAAGAFPELTICNRPGGPSLYRAVADQSELMGLLARFDLGVAVRKMRRRLD